MLCCVSFTLPTFGARVGIVVYAGKMVEIQLGVMLGSGKLAVAEQLLHSADVAGILQQMAGVAVAQHMGAKMSAAIVGGELLQAFLDLTSAEAAAGAAGEQGGFVGRGGAGFQVAFEGTDALGSKG